MNPLQRALIEKAGHDHGFEYVLVSADDSVRLASARHPAQVLITIENSQFVLIFSAPACALLHAELLRSFAALAYSGEAFIASDQDALAGLLRRAADLVHALPNQAAQDFDASLQQQLEQLLTELKGTEVERLVRQRIGQQAFRSAMLSYWGGACAVTGIAISEILRASHAKPWAECISDAERLDVFNGFLLTANLDALFDRFLVTFTEEGVLVVSEKIPAQYQKSLGLVAGMSLRWLSGEHLKYLRYHRDRFLSSDYNLPSRGGVAIESSRGIF